MSIYTLRRILVLLILGGLIYGGWWMYSRRHELVAMGKGALEKITIAAGVKSSATPPPNPTAPPPVASASTVAKENAPIGAPTPNASPSPAVTESKPTPADPDGALVLDIITSATKKDWLQAEIERFNQENKGAYRVETRLIETRDAMQAILNGREKPVLWSPGSSVWTARLVEAYQERNGEVLIDMTDSERVRTYLRTPIVFLTTKQKAEFLRPLLAGPDAWKNIGDMGAGTRKTPWGKLRFSHADPLASNSGFLTLALMLNDYARRNNLDSSDEKTVSSQNFAHYLRSVEAGLVFDIPAKEGSSSLTKAFTRDTTLYDFIVTYESSALSALVENDKLAVIYPEPTVISEQSVVLVNGAWVTDEQREGAVKFLAFLSSQDSMKNGIAAHFRTTQNSGPLSLADELKLRSPNGFRQSLTSIELPRYSALNEAASVWRGMFAR